MQHLKQGRKYSALFLEQQSKAGFLWISFFSVTMVNVHDQSFHNEVTACKKTLCKQ